MVATRKLEIQIVGDSSGAGRVFGNVDDMADKTESKLSKWSKGIAGLIGGAFAVDAIVDFGATLITAAEDAQKVTAQTEAVLTSMGNVAGVTATEVADLAEAISLKTGLDDEMIQSGENVLLTFGNVANQVGDMNNIFDRAVQVATDMSVAMGQDLQSSVVQVGKALNDPIAGLSALSRVGVQFTDEQKLMIEQLVAAGDTLGAQKIILQELEAQFGGSAEAQATASGKLQVAWDNLVETLGTALLPYFEDVANWLSTELPEAIEAAKGWLRDHEGEIRAVAGALQQWWAWGGKVIDFLGGLVDKISVALGWLEKLRNKLEGLPGIGGLFGGAQPGPDARHLVKPGTGFFPALAEGGVVTKPTFALVGESGPEAVVPLSARGIGGMGGDTYITNVHVDGSVLTSGRDLISLINEAVASGYRLQAQGRGL